MAPILVVGAGFMGTGIAQVCAQSRYDVHLMDIDSRALQRALRAMEASLQRYWNGSGRSNRWNVRPTSRG
jgi:3-hydroxyacyl-CoA dehydrogenase